MENWTKAIVMTDHICQVSGWASGSREEYQN